MKEADCYSLYVSSVLLAEAIAPGELSQVKDTEGTPVALAHKHPRDVSAHVKVSLKNKCLILRNLTAAVRRKTNSSLPCR